MNNRILQNSYNKSAPNYDKQLANIQREKYKVMLKDFIWQGGIRVLDLGCGTALLYDFVASTFHSHPIQKMAFDYYGIDFSDKMIQIAQLKKRPHMVLTIGNFASLPYPDQFFDHLFSFTAIGLSDDPIQQIFTQCQRVLKPGGSLVITVLKKTDPLIIEKNLLETGFSLNGKPISCGQDFGFHAYRL